MTEISKDHMDETLANRADNLLCKRPLQNLSSLNQNVLILVADIEI